MFSTLNYCNTKNFYVGDDRSLNVIGFGIIHLDNGKFKDVLYVPTLSCNILWVYQITHSGEGKIIKFTPQQIVIRDLKDPRHVLTTKIIDDITKLYKFDKCGSSSLTSNFVAHSDEVRKLWHEWFGNLNYRSLQNLCKEKMVIGLPVVSCKDSVCSGCVLKKHHQDNFDKCFSWHASTPL